MKTAELLYAYFEQRGDLTRAVVHDLFGCNCTPDNLSLFLGLYKGLYLMDVSPYEIHRCFTENRLDELIHVKYSLRPSNYYKEFCDQNLTIGPTSLGEMEYEDDDEHGEEDDDEHDEDDDAEDEAHINTNDDNEMGLSDSDPDASDLHHTNITPLIYTTITPPYHFQTNAVDAKKHKFSSVKETIDTKIRSYKRDDKKNKFVYEKDLYVSHEDVKFMLKLQENKCYVCGDNVITENWIPKCCYQLTLDRIDNSLSHLTTNVLICCQYCNCRDYQVNVLGCTDTYKVCEYGCHTTIRRDLRRRTDVPKEEIQALKE
jgi:hypothetical protein